MQRDLTLELCYQLDSFFSRYLEVPLAMSMRLGLPIDGCTCRAYYTDMGEKTDMQSKGKKPLAIHLIIGAVLIAAVLFATIIFMQNRNNGSASGKTKSEEVIRKVSELYLLPTNEQPTVAEIKDKTSLQSQDFYKQAENGDFVLVYEKAKLAVLYRESLHKLVKVSPVAPTTNSGAE